MDPEVGPNAKNIVANLICLCHSFAHLEPCMYGFLTGLSGVTGLSGENGSMAYNSSVDVTPIGNKLLKLIQIITRSL